MRNAPYEPRRASTSRHIDARSLRHHLLEWGAPSPAMPSLVMLHGWMDVAASFQFVVDAFVADRHVVAVDWRGFGGTDTPEADTYFFHEYLGDLDRLLAARFGDSAAVDLLGHSMGGNVAMLYAGVRPARVRRLVNLEGFGMPRTEPDEAPARIARWLDSLAAPEQLRPYASIEAVAERLRKTNPLLREDRALWLAGEWSALVAGADDGERRLLADPNHKRSSPQQAQVDEWLASWRRIEAPVLWIEGDRTDISGWWGARYTKAEFHERLSLVRDAERHVVSPAGHMLHHDRPEDVARLVEAFLSESRPSPAPDSARSDG